MAGTLNVYEAQVGCAFLVKIRSWRCPCGPVEGDQGALAQLARVKRYRISPTPMVNTVLNRVPPQLACSGERPVCNRCARLRKTCVFTPTTARSLQFISESNRRTSRASHAVQESNPMNHSDAGESVPGEHSPTDPPAILSMRKDSPYLGISESLMYTLVDVYFENAYNASLLLHKGGSWSHSWQAPLRLILS